MGQIAACVDVGAGSGFKASGRHQSDFAVDFRSQPNTLSE